MRNNLGTMVCSDIIGCLSLNITQKFLREEYETYYEGELRKRLKEAPKLGSAAGDCLPMTLEGNSNLFDSFKRNFLMKEKFF